MILTKLQCIVIAGLLCTTTVAAVKPNQADALNQQLTALEKSINGKIGLYAIDTNTKQVIAHRATERFPIQSTFKVIGVGALLNLLDNNKSLFNKKITVTPKELVVWSPVTKGKVKQGITLGALSQAAISYSDNTAINLIMNQLGGPKKVTEFAYSIGNHSFNLSHYEPNLNSNPMNMDDSATPRDMAESLQKLTLGDALSKANRQKLFTWMKNNTTGDRRIRAGIPAGWSVADKTGSGTFGVANDIGLIGFSSCKPIVLAIYTVSYDEDAKWQDDVLAKVTSLVVNELTKSNSCLRG